MGSSPTVHVPGPSGAEKRLAREQASMLRLQQEMIHQQREQQAVMLPILAEEFGYDIETDEFGNITSIDRTHDPRQEQRDRIEDLLLDRQERALAGDLPVDPGLERNLQQQETDLRNRLQRQFGPGFETSSPAIETLGDFMGVSEALRHGARTGEMSLAQQLSLAREQQGMMRQQNRFGNVQQFGVQNPMGFAGGIGQVAQGFGQALQQHPDRHHRQLTTQANIAQGQMQMQHQQGIGQMIGAGMGLLPMMFSDSRLKENLIEIGKTQQGIPIYEFNYIDDPERRIGVLAEDVEKVRPDAVGDRYGYKTVDYERL